MPFLIKKKAIVSLPPDEYLMMCTPLKMKTAAWETDRNRAWWKEGYKMLEPPRHYDRPRYAKPPRNPLIPAALCTSDSFMSSIREAADGDGGSGITGKILICLLLWKNMHIHLAFRLSEGRGEEMGNLSEIVCVWPLCMCTYVYGMSPPFNGSVLLLYSWAASLHHGCHSNINDLGPQQKKQERSCVLPSTQHILC